MLPKVLKLSLSLVISSGTVSQFSFAGDSRGGGNVVVGNLASKEAIRQEIKQTQPSLVAFFNRWETISYFQVKLHNQIQLSGIGIDLNMIFEKLFRRAKTIFSEIESSGYIDSSHFEILEHGPCHDLDGKEVDASAFNTKSGKTCFSLERLSKKLTYSDMYLQILGLKVHESSHRVDATEEEANFLQNLALDTVTNKGKEILREIAQDVRSQFKSLEYDANSVLTALEAQLDDREICSALTPMTKTAMMSQQIFLHSSSQTGLAVLGAKDSNEINGFAIKAFAPAMYCLKEDDFRKKPFQDYFKGRTYILTSEWMKQFNRDEESQQYGNLKIRYISSEDRKTLKAELVEIKGFAQKIQERIKW